MIEQREETVEGGLPQRHRSGPQLPDLKIPLSRSSIGDEEAFWPTLQEVGLPWSFS